MRWFDLARTTKLVERVKKYVPAFVASKPSPIGTDNYGSNAAVNIKDFHVLRPFRSRKLTAPAAR